MGKVQRLIGAASSVFYAITIVIAVGLVSLLRAPVLGVNIAFAQDEGADEEFFDDEEYIDEDGANDAGGDVDANRFRGGFGADGVRQPRISSPGGIGSGFSGNSHRTGGFGSGDGLNGDEIEFRLVQPPQFWTPKKRKLFNRSKQ